MTRHGSATTVKSCARPGFCVRSLAFVTIVLVAGAIMLPSTLAHNAQVAPEQYIRFLSDCSDDWGGHSAVRDGHDLVALDMTERWIDEHDEPGFFVMLTLAFGFAETGSRGGPLRDDVELTGPDGAIKVRLVTDDNSAFRAEQAQGFRIPDVMVPVRPSLLSNGQPDGSRMLVEFGFRFSTLGLETGDKITGAKVQAFAQQDQGDYMPGGYYLAGIGSSQNINDCPQSGHQGGGDPGTRYVRKDYPMRGTETPYIDLIIDTDAIAVSGAEKQSFSVIVRNKFANQPQDVTVTAIVPSGWKTSETAKKPVPALQQATIPMELFAPTGTAPNGTMKLIIDTSLGGHGEREVAMYWYPKGVEATVPVTPTADAPGPAGVLLAIFLFAFALLRRRSAQ